MDKIKELRLKIDEVDERILELFKKRMEVAGEIGVIKKENRISVQDRKRERELMDNLEQKAQKRGLDQSLVKNIWKYLIKLSYEAER